MVNGVHAERTGALDIGQIVVNQHGFAGPEAAGYRFTSALAVQILKLLAPTLQPLLNSPTASWSEDLRVETPLPPSDLPYL